MRTVVLPEGAAPSVQAGYAQILGVHAALLHTGQIVYFSGDEHDPGRYSLGLFDHARLFDCTTFAVSSPSPHPGIRDLFCCGHALLPDGRVLVGGGTEAWTATLEAGADPHGHAALGHFRGTPNAYIFDPTSRAWQDAARMVPEPGMTTGGGRWYPTLLTLGDGRVLAISGHPSDADTRHYNDTVEAYSRSPAPLGHWAPIGTVPGEVSYYARGHLLPDGNVFFDSPIGGQNHRFNPATGAWAPVCAGPPIPYDGISTTAALLPLTPEDGYRPRVLIAGAADPKVIDLGAATPSWQNTVPRTLLVGGTPPVRAHSTAVILPTGEVAIVGGLRDPGQDPATAVLPIEIFEPSTNSWVTMPAVANCHVPRNYHSVALLMPDGRVWMAAGNKGAKWSYHNPADYPTTLPTDAQEDAIDNRELRIELFEPWYHGRTDRPIIAAAPAATSVGASFTIGSPQAASINRVAAIRCGTATHAFNPDQRYVGLPFTSAAGVITVHVPDNEYLLPPGYYLLFIVAGVIDGTTGIPLNVPSTGHFLRIDNAKFRKEFKFEFEKLLLPELKDLRPELFKDRKGEVEGFEEPWLWAVDPATLLRQLAERIDNLERREAVGEAFIPAEARPEVALSAIGPIGKTPQRSLEELLMAEHPATQMAMHEAVVMKEAAAKKAVGRGTRSSPRRVSREGHEEH